MTITLEQRLDLLKVEMQILQTIFNKYDDMMFRSRNWFITLWAATVGLSFTIRVPTVALSSAGLALLYWFFEGNIRSQHWYKYVVRYRVLRDALNNDEISLEKVSVYDLTNHLGTTKSSWWKRIWESYGRFEPLMVYGMLGVTAVFAWWAMSHGLIPLPVNESVKLGD